MQILYPKAGDILKGYQFRRFVIGLDDFSELLGDTGQCDDVILFRSCEVGFGI